MSKVFNAFLTGMIKAAVLTNSVSTGVNVQQAPKVGLQPAQTRIAGDVAKSIQNPVTRHSDGTMTPLHRAQPVSIPPVSTAPRVASSPDIYARLKQEEGFRSEPYNDTLGHKTIGYGSTDPKMLQLGKVTEPEAASALTNKVNNVDASIGKLVGNNWGSTPQPVKDSVVDLGYQTGSLTKWPKLLESLKANNYENTAKEMQNSLVNQQTPERNAGRISLIEQFLKSQNMAKQ
jgi:GH24 family phage-related lysozyme (muramidase)